MFKIDKSVMLLIDVQERLSQVMYEKEKLFESLEIIIKSMKILDIPIIWLEQIPEKLGHTIPRLSQHLNRNEPIEKFSFSCCNEPEFVSKFKEIGRTQVILTGIETHICVFQTAFNLIEQGNEVQVVNECVSSRTKENKDIGIQRILQSKGKLASLEMVLFELLQNTKVDKFKKIIKLIK